MSDWLDRLVEGEAKIDQGQYKVKRAHERGVRFEYGEKLEPSQQIEEESENVSVKAKTI